MTMKSRQPLKTPSITYPAPMPVRGVTVGSMPPVTQVTIQRYQKSPRDASHQPSGNGP
jgi:hypothetical protein